MKFIFAMAALAMAIAVAECFQCPPGYCSRVRCMQVTEEDCGEDQVFFEKGSTCGCCNACRTIIKEGGNCASLLLQGGGAPTEVCANGTSCSQDTKTCEATKC